MLRLKLPSPCRQSFATRCAAPAEAGNSRRGHFSTGTFRPFGPPEGVAYRREGSTIPERDPKLDTGNRQSAAAVGTWTGLRPGPPRALRGPASDWGYLRRSYTFHTP